MPAIITADIIWDDCGDWNGYYFPSVDLIVLCNEDLDLPPGAARMIELHEMGHAFQMERKLGLERWGGSQEDQADEFAMILTLTQGRAQDLLEMAQVWDGYAKKVGVVPGDTHSPAATRAQRLRSMYWGYVMGFGPDYFYFKESVEFWHTAFQEADAHDGHP